MNNKGQFKKTKAAVHGRKGGLSRARNLSAEERSASAAKAANARWAKIKNPLVNL